MNFIGRIATCNAGLLRSVLHRATTGRGRYVPDHIRKLDGVSHRARGAMSKFRGLVAIIAGSAVATLMMVLAPVGQARRPRPRRRRTIWLSATHSPKEYSRTRLARTSKPTMDTRTTCTPYTAPRYLACNLPSSVAPTKPRPP